MLIAQGHAGRGINKMLISRQHDAGFGLKVHRKIELRERRIRSLSVKGIVTTVTTPYVQHPADTWGANTYTQTVYCSLRIGILYCCI